MGRADFELANLELIQRNSTEETKIVWQTRVPQKVDPASIARFRSAVRGEYADTKLLIYGLFQKVRVLAQDGVRHHGSEDNTLGLDDCKAHGPWAGRKHRR